MQQDEDKHEMQWSNGASFPQGESNPEPRLFSSVWNIPPARAAHCLEPPAGHQNSPMGFEEPLYNKIYQLRARIRNLCDNLSRYKTPIEFLPSATASLPYNSGTNYFAECCKEKLAYQQKNRAYDELTKLMSNAATELQELERVIEECERKQRQGYDAVQNEIAMENKSESSVLGAVKQELQVKVQGDAQYPSSVSNSQSFQSGDHRCPYSNCYRLYTSRSSLNLHINKAHWTASEEPKKESHQRRAKHKAREQLATINRAQYLMQKEEEEQEKQKQRRKILYEQYLLNNPSHAFRKSGVHCPTDMVRSFYESELIKVEQPSADAAGFEFPQRSCPKLLPEEVLTAMRPTVSVQVPENFQVPSIVPAEFVEEMLPSTNFRYGRLRISESLLKQLPIFSLPKRAGLLVEEQRQPCRFSRAYRSQSVAAQGLQSAHPYSI